MTSSVGCNRGKILEMTQYVEGTIQGGRMTMIKITLSSFSIYDKNSPSSLSFCLVCQFTSCCCYYYYYYYYSYYYLSS